MYSKRQRRAEILINHGMEVENEIRALASNQCDQEEVRGESRALVLVAMDIAEYDGLVAQDGHACHKQEHHESHPCHRSECLPH